MKYSFTKPKPKKRIDPESRILLAFLTLIVFLIVGFATVLFVQRISMQREMGQMRKQMSLIRQETQTHRKEIARIQKLVERFETVQTDNVLLKESIQNLFDLIPDQITLTRATLDRHGLILYGVTPSKEVYNYLLLAPLKSVFKRNITNFYPMENGWLKFVSINEGTLDTGERETE